MSEETETGLDDLLVDANARLMGHKTGKVRGYNDAMAEYLNELRRCLDGRNAVQAWDRYMAQALSVSLAPEPVVIEDKQTRFAQLASLLTSPD